MVWKLQMPTSQKLAVTGIFMLGAFVVGISVARVYFFFSVGANIERAWDITYERAPTIYWSQLEAAIAIVCACLPTLRVLFVDISLETIAKRFASKISLFSGSKSSFRTMPKPSQGSISSASGLQQTGEAIRLSSLDQPHGRDFHGKA
ncbi:putative integral membrane protein pth11- protein [Eutypa lata UCREL1]|uniref:Putative integral membrane protein pth11-protein n=1 Tax=Eutypa lata (strain UCR-EL1) TaxID=1287681 RepID=M7SR63_EUTLA|nr:putative integral membrane protein pth11- protein [Eutypa lata UCREL1]